MYVLLRDFSAVTLLAIQPILVVPTSLPAQSIAELVKLAKASPGAINYSSSGPGSNSFLAAKRLNSLAEIKMVHVPYIGGGPQLRRRQQPLKHR